METDDTMLAGSGHVMLEELSNYIKQIVYEQIDIAKSTQDMSNISLQNINTMLELVKESIYLSNKSTIDTDNIDEIQNTYIKYFNGIFDDLCDLYDICKSFYTPDHVLFDSNMTTKRRCSSCGMFVNIIRLYFFYILKLSKENIIFLYTYNNEIPSQKCCIITIFDQVFFKVDNKREAPKRSNIMRSPLDGRYEQDTFIRSSLAIPRLNYADAFIEQNDMALKITPYSKSTFDTINNILKYTSVYDMINDIVMLNELRKELNKSREALDVAKVIDEIIRVSNVTKEFRNPETQEIIDEETERNYIYAMGQLYRNLIFAVNKEFEKEEQ